MFLWELRRTQVSRYDEQGAVVVAAEDDLAARTFAAENCGDEGADLWFDPELSTCTALGMVFSTVDPGVIVTDK